jgi:adenylate cyclase
MSFLRRLLQSPVAASLVASTLVFLGIIALRRAGSLEALELAAYDWHIRLQLDAAVADPRLVLIAITEHDIQHLGRWPLPDVTLAEALERLTQYQPRAIGLDIYRDIAVPSGREHLETLLTSHRHIVTVTKVGEGGAEGVGET